MFLFFLVSFLSLFPLFLDSLVVRASCFCIHELRAVSLGQQQLKELLSRAPYAGRLSDEATAAKYSLAQLSTLVQCSRKELSDAMAKLDAFEVRICGFIAFLHCLNEWIFFAA